jgi:hypothetical protein
MEDRIKKMSEEIFLRSKYYNCLLPHRETILKAMFKRNLCPIWKALENCEIPCEDRWAIIKLIMEKAEEDRPEGPNLW